MRELRFGFSFERFFRLSCSHFVGSVRQPTIFGSDDLNKATGISTGHEWALAVSFWESPYDGSGARLMKPQSSAKRWVAIRGFNNPVSHGQRRIRSDRSVHRSLLLLRPQVCCSVFLSFNHSARPASEHGRILLSAHLIILERYRTSRWSYGTNTGASCANSSTACLRPGNANRLRYLLLFSTDSVEEAAALFRAACADSAIISPPEPTENPREKQLRKELHSIHSRG